MRWICLWETMTVDSNGSVYVTGTSRTVKYNSAGVLQWTANYAGRAAEAVTA